MRVVFSQRALRNIRKILTASERAFGSAAADALEKRISKSIEQIANAPESAPRLENRPATRVLWLVGYPFRIFYRVGEDAVEISHVRHTSRRPWTENVD